MTIAVPNPGDIVASSWGSDVAATINSLAGPWTNYTPALTNVAVGTGGSNEAKWRFIGGEAVGDVGLLIIDGRIILGTSGFSVSGAITVALPAGFEIDSIFATTNVGFGGHVKHNPAGTGTGGHFGYLRRGGGASANTVELWALTVSGSSILVGATSATAPATWVAGGNSYYTILIPAKRV